MVQYLVRLALLVVSGLAASGASAIDHQSGTEPYQTISAVPIPIQGTSKTVLGQAYTFPAGTPLIKPFKITIEPGMKTGPHKHAIPLLEYLDTAGLTRRLGDGRGWLGRSAPRDAQGNPP